MTKKGRTFLTSFAGNLSVWSSVLAAADVADHYADLCADSAAVPAAGTGLLGSWDFTAPDANGDFADKSANGNDVYVFVEWIDKCFSGLARTLLPTILRNAHLNGTYLKRRKTFLFY